MNHVDRGKQGAKSGNRRRNLCVSSALSPKSEKHVLQLSGGSRSNHTVIETPAISFQTVRDRGFSENRTRGRTLRRGAQVLLRPTYAFAQSGCGVQRPIGIAQLGSRQKHKVRLAVGDDCVGLRWFGDEPHCGRGDAGFTADPGGKADLIAGRKRNFRIRHVAAR